MVLNGFQLKVIAAALMVLDHIGQFMWVAPLWFRYVGRVVAPIFFFLLVEGFTHTRSKGRYMARLLGAGYIMSIGSGILTELLPGGNLMYNNIFFSLGLGVALMWALEWSKRPKRRLLGWALAVLAAAGSLYTEAHLYGVMMVLVFYYCREKPKSLAVFYILGAIFPVFSSGTVTIHSLFFYNYQWLMVFALPFLLSYNGEAGPRNPFTKWFFYVFYPLHLWVIYILSIRMF
ncbi:MAG: conjugal transfer protein TraX [Firmicutes bacterium]|nr:conjugal transfer protein TraX [Bacillota bacterium]